MDNIFEIPQQSFTKNSRGSKSIYNINAIFQHLKPQNVAPSNMLYPKKFAILLQCVLISLIVLFFLFLSLVSLHSFLLYFLSLVSLFFSFLHSLASTTENHSDSGGVEVFFFFFPLSLSSLLLVVVVLVDCLGFIFIFIFLEVACDSESGVGLF